MQLLHSFPLASFLPRSICSLESVKIAFHIHDVSHREHILSASDAPILFCYSKLILFCWGDGKGLGLCLLLFIYADTVNETKKKYREARVLK